MHGELRLTRGIEYFVVYSNLDYVGGFSNIPTTVESWRPNVVYFNFFVIACKRA